MVSLLDQIDIIEETDTYTNNGTHVMEDIGESPLTLEETPVEFDNIADPENPELVAFRSLLFDTIYHQLDIREWVL